MRKQTLYLFLIVVLLAMLQLFPLATLTSIAPAGAVVFDTDVISFDIWGMHYSAAPSQSLIYLGILVSLATAVAIVALVAHKKRQFQVRMCVVLAILLLGVLVFEGMYFFKLNAVTGFLVNYSTVMLAPLFALVLTYMSYKGVKYDLALLAAADRVR